MNPYADNKHVFLPNVPIKVTVTAELRRGKAEQIFSSPYIYTLNLTHGNFTWQSIQTYKKIKELHKTLAKIVKGDIGRSCSDLSKTEIKQEWPLFPTQHEHILSATLLDDRCKKLANYLERLLTYPPFRDHSATLSLLGVSPLSFVNGLSSSLIECLLKKEQAIMFTMDT